MTIVFNGIKCELDKNLSPDEVKFYEKMKRLGFLFTYYQAEDTVKGSIEGVTIKLKDSNKVPLLK